MQNNYKEDKKNSKETENNHRKFQNINKYLNYYKTDVTSK